MRIECGNYILMTDSCCNIWIEEKYMGKDKEDNPKEYTKRITGYLHDFSSLTKDFLNKKLCGSDAENMVDVLNELNIAKKEIDEIYNRYKVELGE